MKLRLILEAKLILVVDVIESQFAEVFVRLNLMNHFRKSALTVNEHFKVEISLQSIFNICLVTLTLNHDRFKLFIILEDTSVTLYQEQCLLVKTQREFVTVFKHLSMLGEVNYNRSKRLFDLLVCKQD